MALLRNKILLLIVLLLFGFIGRLSAYYSSIESYYPDLDNGGNLNGVTIYCIHKSYVRVSPAGRTTYYSNAKLAMIVTLAGLMSRAKGNEYIVFYGYDKDEKWAQDLEKLGATLDFTYDVSGDTNLAWNIINAFKNTYISSNSYIEYNISNDSFNVANSFAAVYGAVIADGAIAADLENHCHLTNRRDFSSYSTESDGETIFNNEWKNWSGACDDVLIEMNDAWQNADQLTALRDYAVAIGAWVYYDSDNGAPQTTYFDWAEDDSIVMGWGAGAEWDHVGEGSSYAVGTIPADWSRNLSSFAALSSKISITNLRSPYIPSLRNLTWEDKRFATFIMSDGDNLQWQQTGFWSDSRHWGNSYRGSFNMGWSICPSLWYVAAPAIDVCFNDRIGSGYKIKSTDQFVGGVSGMSYMYVGTTGVSETYGTGISLNSWAHSTHAERLAKWMKQYGITASMLMVKDGTEFSSYDFANFANNISRLDGFYAVTYDGAYKDAAGYANKWVDNKDGLPVPVIKCKYSIWNGFDDEDTVSAGLNGFSGTPAFEDFVYINCHAWYNTDDNNIMNEVARTISKLDTTVKVMKPLDMLMLARVMLKSSDTLGKYLSFIDEKLDELDSLSAPNSSALVAKNNARTSYNTAKTYYDSADYENCFNEAKNADELTEIARLSYITNVHRNTGDVVVYWYEPPTAMSNLYLYNIWEIDSSLPHCKSYYIQIATNSSFSGTLVVNNSNYSASASSYSVGYADTTRFFRIKAKGRTKDDWGEWSGTVIVPGNPYTVSVTKSTDNIEVASGSSVLSFKIVDKKGYLVDFATNTINISITSGYGTLSSSTVKAVSGEGSVTYNAGTKAVTNKITFSGSGLVDTVVNVVTIAGAKSLIYVYSSKTNIKANGSDSTYIYAQISDAYSNIISSANDIVQFSITSGPGSLTNTNISAVNGIAKNKFVSGFQVGKTVIDASVTGLSSGSVTLSNYTGTPYALEMTCVPDSLFADNNDNSFITVVIKDSAGDRVVNATNTIRITNLDGTGTLDYGEYIKAEEGIATNRFRTTVAASNIIATSVPGLPTVLKSTQVIISTLNTNIPIYISLEASEQRLTADKVDNTVLKAYIKNIKGKTLETNMPVYFKRELYGTIKYSSPINSIDGIATNVYISPTNVSIVKIVASNSSLDKGEIYITNIAGPKHHIISWVDSGKLTANGYDDTTVHSKIVDYYGNLVSSWTDKITYILSGGGSMIGDNPYTVRNGFAEITYKASTSVENVIISAVSTNVLGDSVIITNDYGPPCKISLSADRYTISSHDADVVTLNTKILDAWDRELTSSDITNSIRFVIDTSFLGPHFTNGDVTKITNIVKSVNGIAETYISSTYYGTNFSVSANSTGLIGSSVKINMTSGTVAYKFSLIDINKSYYLIDDNIPVSISLNLQDYDNNVVTDDSKKVCLTITRAAGFSNIVSISEPIYRYANNGVVTFPALSFTDPGIYKITISADGMIDYVIPQYKVLLPAAIENFTVKAATPTGIVSVSLPENSLNTNVIILIKRYNEMNSLQKNTILTANASLTNLFPIFDISLVTNSAFFVEVVDKDNNVLTNALKSSVTVKYQYNEKAVPVYYDSLNSGQSAPGTLYIGDSKIKEDTVKLFRLDEKNSWWDMMNDSIVDRDNNILTVSVNKFYVYSLIGENEEKTISKNTVYQNFPNPVNIGNGGVTVIKFAIGAGIENETVDINIFDLSGNLVKHLVDNEVFSQGIHHIIWDGRDLSNSIVGTGIYICTVKIGNSIKSFKIAVVK